MSETFRGKTEAEYEVEMEKLRDEHSKWKGQMHQENTGFIPIFSQKFKPYLKKIQGPAIRLYMFLAMNSRSDVGEVWVTQKQIEQFFECSPRSVINWLDELEKYGLIKRFQTGYKKEGRIFLKPYDPKNIVQYPNK